MLTIEAALAEARKGGRARLVVANVEGEHLRVRADPRGGGVERINIAPVEPYSSAPLGQPLRDLEAEPARRARHQRNASCK